MEVIGTFVAALLTIMVLSYVFGSNPIVRIAEYIFLGVTTGYLVVVSIYDVLGPRLIIPLRTQPQDNLGLLVLLVLALLLLARINLQQLKRISWLANIPLALAVGVGAGLVLTGAISGSIVTQVSATGQAGANIAGALNNPGTLIGGIILLVGTIVILMQFYFTSQRTGAGAVLRIFDILGRPLMMVGFGAVFASLAASAIAQLAERITFLVRPFLG